ncbi:MAG: hypothetical protein AB1696_14875 [Planctomycetota bacterium]
MKPKHLLLIIFLLLSPCCIARDDMHQTLYQMAIHDCLENVPELAEFVELYPDAIYAIGCIYQVMGQEKAQPTELTAEALIEERYHLVFSLKMKWFAGTGSVKRYGEPTYELREFQSVELRKAADGSVNGRGYRYNVESAKRFGPKEWRKLVVANGDFSVINITLTKGHPVPGVKEIFQSRRREKMWWQKALRKQDEKNKQQ